VEIGPRIQGVHTWGLLSRLQTSELALAVGAKPLLRLQEWQHPCVALCPATIPNLNTDFEDH